MDVISKSVPVVGVGLLAASWGRSLPSGVLAVLGLVLVAAVLVAVHHAEVVAHRVGEPFGSLILAVAVTVIEVGLIVVLMTGSTDGAPTLARDTVFAAVIITCNAIVGLSLLAATFRGGVARFNAAGAGSGLAAVALLATLTLVLPTVTTSETGPVFSTAQLVSVAIEALAVYLLFVFVQAVRHRNYFLPPREAGRRFAPDQPSTTRQAWISGGLLVLSLVTVVGLGKTTTPVIESAVTGLGLPLGAVAVAIALIVLAPETLAAWRAARRGRTQISLNLAYGSAMASIGLTIPVVAVLSLAFDLDLLLGLTPREITLLAITFIVSILTVTPGRATLLQGGLHLVLFVSFITVVLAP